MKTISFDRFLKYMEEQKKYPEKRFCFILGAGASKQSGIPTGSELAKRWFEEIKNISNKEEFEIWLNTSKINEENLSDHYTEIYKERFIVDKFQGYQVLQQMMEGINPSCGYAILSQILVSSQHNTVITTNFDSLTEDALFIYTQKKPLVIGHELLSDFASPFISRPLIIKIHRDLYLAPQNTSEETDSLNPELGTALSYIFKYYTPIIIGYGGNDGSLMGLMENIELNNRLFWLQYQRDTDHTSLSDRITGLMEKHNGTLIKTGGFDEIMIQMGSIFDINYNSFGKEICKIANQRAEIFEKQIRDIILNSETDNDVKDALSEGFSKGEESALSFLIRSEREPNLEIKANIVADGLKEYPSNLELIEAYAKVLTELNDLDKANQYYQKTIDIDSKNSERYNTYAKFLKNIYNDPDAAEQNYLKAIKIDSENSVLYNSYGIFLKEFHKDFHKAEQNYLKAIEVNPKDTAPYNNYANLLCDFSTEYEKSEAYYRKGIALNKKKAGIYGNYAKLLIIQKRFHEALENINKSMELNKNRKRIPLEIELWFYRYAIFYKDYPESKEMIASYLKLGYKSLRWDLSKIVEIAEEIGHPDIEQVKDFAKQITEVV